MDYRFELIEGTATLKGTCYFEFCAESNRGKTCWNEDAFYLEDDVFNFLCSVFIRANKKFDYYDFCKFEKAQLQMLKDQLIDFETTVSSFQRVEEYEDFFARLVKFPGYEEENRGNWKRRSDELKNIATHLISLVEGCIKSNDALWVLGM